MLSWAHVLFDKIKKKIYNFIENIEEKGDIAVLKAIILKNV